MEARLYSFLRSDACAGRRRLKYVREAMPRPRVSSFLFISSSSPAQSLSSLFSKLRARRLTPACRSPHSS